MAHFWSLSSSSIYRVLDGSYIPSQGLLNNWYIRTIISSQFLQKNPSRKFSLRGDSLSSRKNNFLQVKKVILVWDLHVAFSLFIISDLSVISSRFSESYSCIFQYMTFARYNIQWNIIYSTHMWDWSHSRPFWTITFHHLVSNDP